MSPRSSRIFPLNMESSWTDPAGTHCALLPMPIMASRSWSWVPVSGMVCAYELMRMGLHPVVLEASDRIGGRLYSKKLGNPGDGVICELGGMRFPVSAKALFHYFERWA